METQTNAYSVGRRRSEKAASYDTKYDRELHKRISKRREKRLLEAILARTGENERLLDVPSGTGRLSDVLARHGERLYEVDYSLEMLRLCRKNCAAYQPRLAEATALRLPFADGTFDLAVSIRLSHHLPEREARLAHVRELLRVSRRCALITFFDEGSWKNRLREARRRFLASGKRPKYTLRRDEVRRVAAEQGFRVVGFWPLSRLFSGHDFALFERASALSHAGR
jgi:SAM-dependent methyltransferase